MFRTIIWFTYFVLHTLATTFSLLLVNIMAALGKKDWVKIRIYKTGLRWARALVFVTGSKVEVEGVDLLPQQGPILFVANHQGNFDIPLLMGFVPGAKGFIAKIELEKIPVLSTWMKKMHSVFLDRKNLRKSLLTMREAIGILKEGHSLVVFPEGTRSKGKPMAEFKRGSLSIAEKANVLVVPITIVGSYKIMEGNKGSRVKPANVKIIISKPIHPGKLEQGQDLATVVRNAIQEKLTSV